MKKTIALILAALMLVLPGCGKKEETEEKQGTAVDASLETRHFFYQQEGKLFYLDAKTKESYPVSVSGEPTDDVAAKLSQNGKIITFLMGGELYKWEIGTKEAQLIDSGVSGCRVNEKMDVLLYVKEETEERRSVYVHTPKNGSKLVTTGHDSSIHVSLQKNGNGILLEEIDQDQFQGLNQGDIIPAYNVESVLYQVAADGTRTKLVKGIWNTIAVSEDHSTVCYTKKEGEPVGTMTPAWPAYILTEQGEQRLPFYAFQMQVFGPKEIYYVLGNGDRWEHYYFDGEESHLLVEDANNEGFKVGNHFYAMTVPGAEYHAIVAYKGETVSIPEGRYNLTLGYTGAVSPDGNTMYIWAREKIFAVSQENGSLTSRLFAQTGEYSPRTMMMYGNTLLAHKEAYHKPGNSMLNGNQTEPTEQQDPMEIGLFLNDVRIADVEAFGELSMDGNKAVYWENGDLYHYADGKKTKISDHVEGNAYPLDDGNALYIKNWTEETGGTLCLGNGTAETVIGNGIQKVNVVIPWGTSEVGSIVIDVAQNSTVAYDYTLWDYLIQ